MNKLSKIRHIYIFISAIAWSGNVLAQDNENTRSAVKFSLGAGVVSSPSFLGADNNQVNAVPNLSISFGERLSASLRGIEYLAISGNHWKAGPVLSYHFGREELTEDGPFTVSGSSLNNLVGLGDIDGTIEIGGFVEYQTRSLSTKLELSYGIDGGYEGFSVDASLAYRRQFMIASRPAFVSVGPAMSFADDAYNSTFFDVSASQSAASGISEFDASGGVNSIGLHMSVLMPLTQKTALAGFARFDNLSGSVADSSIVNERGSTDQITTGVFVNHRF